ncbi:hypothetical protein AL546_017580 [Vibrio vulnificus]|nr:hypothetical protein COO31_015715 [Vibrio vulnificus]PNM60282.1 hypothetical protein AL546_017580 [Vibrio vulnificus]
MNKLNRISRDVILQYVSFLVYKVCNGFLYSLTIFFFVDDVNLTNLIGVLFIQEFYFSYFYTAKKNQNIEKGDLYGKESYFLLGSVIFVSYAIYTSFSLSGVVYSIMAFNFISFALFASIAPEYERRDVSSWIRLENRCSLLSAVSIFILSAMFRFIDVNFDEIILLRLGIVFFSLSLYHYIFSKEVFHYKNEWKSFFQCLDIVVILCVMKLLYFRFGISSGEIEGKSIKYFLIFYDLVAAIAGLYMRRTISIEKAKLGQVNFSILKINIFILISILVLSLIWGCSNFIKLPITSSIIFLSVAINYNYFTIVGFSKLWLLKVTYVIVIITSLHMESFEITLILIFINLIYSSLSCRRGKCY